jgi:hypothetical protein
MENNTSTNITIDGNLFKRLYSLALNPNRTIILMEKDGAYYCVAYNPSQNPVQYGPASQEEADQAAAAYERKQQFYQADSFEMEGNTCTILYRYYEDGDGLYLLLEMDGQNYCVFVNTDEEPAGFYNVEQEQLEKVVAAYNADLQKQQNQIYINGRPFDLVFTYRKEDRLLCLLTCENEAMVVEMDPFENEPKLKNVSKQEQQEVLDAYTKAREDYVLYQGKMYEIDGEVSGVLLVKDENEPNVRYAFQERNGNIEPLYLDEDGRRFYKNMWIALLEENLDWLESTKCTLHSVSDLKQNGHKLKSMKDDVDVYISLEKDGSSGMSFVDAKTDKLEVSPRRQEILREQFLDYCKQEFEDAKKITLKNLDE